VNAQDPAAWADFGVALTGASAALAGLVFVAISINLRSILSEPGVSGRAAEGVMTLVIALVAAALLLVPGQGTAALGLEWVALAILSTIVLGRTYRRAAPIYEGRRAILAGRIATHGTAVLALLVAGIATTNQLTGGLYWFVPASLWTIMVGISDAWVLLIEILR
jgi:hypothetical protein